MTDRNEMHPLDLSFPGRWWVHKNHVRITWWEASLAAKDLNNSVIDIRNKCPLKFNTLNKN